jgi:hypothetical protein
MNFRMPGLLVPHSILVVGSAIIFIAAVITTVFCAFALSAKKWDEALGSLLRARSKRRPLVSARVDRRRGVDRRRSQRPFEGPERRFGHDRRHLAAA